MGTAGWGESCTHQERTSPLPRCGWSKAAVEQHVRSWPDKATCLHITSAVGGAGGRPLASVKLISASPSVCLLRRIRASSGDGLRPAGLPPPACRCQSWGSGDNPVRGGEELKKRATEPFSPPSSTRQQSVSRS